MEQALFDATTAEQIEVVRQLLQSPAINVNWGESEFDRTALIRACFKGNREIVKLFLSDPRVNVNRRQAQGATPLNIASQYQRADVVQVLLQDPRVDVNLPNNEGGSPFFYACAFDSVDCFRFLLAHPLVNVNQPNNHGVTPFLLACESRQNEIFDALVTHPDVDVNRGNAQGITPLHVVSCESSPSNVRRVRELLKRRANVNAANVGGITPVERAIQFDAIKVVKEMMISEQVLKFDRRLSKKNFSGEMAALVGSYQVDREKTVFDLQFEIGHPVQFAAYTFGLGVLVSDDYICMRPDTPPRVSRFLGIMARLPIELQMLLSLRTHSSGATHIPKRRLEHSLKSIFQAFGH